MTSGHANVNYGSAHNSHSNAGHSNTPHSNTPHSNTGIVHSNTGSIQVDKGGIHSLSYGSPSAVIPNNTCEGSLSTLYTLSESVRTQYIYNRKRDSSLLPSLETTFIKLGETSDTKSILYNLLNNADNDNSSETSPSKISYTLNIAKRQNYVNDGAHSNHSSHSSTSGDIDGTGEKSTGSKVIHSSSSPMGARTVDTSVFYPNYIDTFKSKQPSEMTDPGAAKNTLALKSQINAVYGFLNSSKVSTNSIGRESVTLSAYSTDTGHSSSGHNNSGHNNTGHSSHSSHSNDYSMRKCKTDIHEFTGSAIDLIDTISIVSFKYKPGYGDPTITHYGFIADDTLEEFSTQYHDRMEHMNCIGLLLKAVQELSNRVNILEDKLHENNK